MRCITLHVLGRRHQGIPLPNVRSSGTGMLQPAPKTCGSLNMANSRLIVHSCSHALGISALDTLELPQNQTSFRGVGCHSKQDTVCRSAAAGPTPVPDPTC